MGLITIDGLDKDAEAALEERARENGRTLADEAKAVLRSRARYGARRDAQD
ncbi:FitA-like ribbon-helix-helix domain-containing protein [Rhizobium sp. G21]|uniref:FitA-like ribbon-helix-helix domain-containing protein n=1 Tax=Rhizobium sp. G21 TaxID=2758439 RepID=UPI0015FEBA82|nr:TraY domain-containing protein [Rhizobium sp. G21]MBB1248276.1 hypothetical protein [Rhizobium sp. G21]